MSDPIPAPADAAVALVRSNNRRGAVAEAMALLEEDLGRLIPEPGLSVLLMPTLGPSARRSTPASVLAAVVDAVLAAGGRPTVAHPDASGDPWGFRAECWGRPVDFVQPSARPCDRLFLLATVADLRIVNSCPADLVLIEGPLDWRGRRVVAVAGIAASVVAGVAAHECGLLLGGPPLDLSTVPLLGDPPRGSRVPRSTHRRHDGESPAPMTATAPRAAAPRLD